MRKQNRLMVINFIDHELNMYLCPIKKDSSIKFFWEFVINCTRGLSYFLIPTNIATIFLPLKNYVSVEIFIDFMIVIDIILNFVTEIEIDGETINHIRRVSLMYLKSYFLIDLISVVTLFYWEPSNFLQYLKVARFFRIKRMFGFFDSLEVLLN